jgi:hypothetical protein
MLEKHSRQMRGTIRADEPPNDGRNARKAMKNRKPLAYAGSGTALAL